MKICRQPTHEEEDVVEQEEEPSPGSSREENGDYDGRDDTSERGDGDN